MLLLYFKEEEERRKGDKKICEREKEKEKACIKLSIKKTKIMASGPITSWQIEGGKSGSSDRFYFLELQITEGGDCSHEFKRHLLLGRKAMTNLDRKLKKRHDFANKGLYSQS